MDKKMSREEAERLADALIEQQPRQRGWQIAANLARLFKSERARMEHEFSKNPFVSPTAPAWGSVHRDTKTWK